MAAKIIMEETTVGTVDTLTTVYTVPSDKAARVRVMFIIEAHASTKYQLSIKVGTPGTENTLHFSSAAGVDMWTGVTEQSTPDPALSYVSEKVGVQRKSGEVYLTTNTNQPQMWWVAPLPHDYYLATGDTVRIMVTEALPIDFLFQVMGVEDDA